MHSATTLQLKLAAWQEASAQLWNLYCDSNRERTEILAPFDSWCCFGDRKCRCDFRDYASKEQIERVDELDFLCMSSIRERRVFQIRILFAQRVLRVMQMRPIHVPVFAAAMREMEAA